MSALPARMPRLCPRMAALAGALCLVAVLPARAASSPVSGESSTEAYAEEQEPARERVGPDVPVRRWEYVVLVRTSTQVPNASSRAEKAAVEAGAAVLDSYRDDLTNDHADYRLLLRTREEVAIQDVLVKMRREAGVLGAATVQLPETPTFPGGPSFLMAYTADEPERSSSGAIVHRDLPPMLDKRDLLETVPVPAGPQIETSGLGGFGLNLSAMVQALKARAWRKREERMRETPLNILPDGGEDDGASQPASPSSSANP